MKTIGQFIAENPQRLNSQLSQLESNIVKETQDIRASFATELEQKSFSLLTPVTARLYVGQVGLCDTSVGNLSVTLASDPKHTPGFLAVLKTSAANTLTLFPTGANRVGASAQIDGAASFARGAIGLLLIYFDGFEWWA